MRKNTIIAPKAAFKATTPCSSTPCGKRSLNAATNKTPAAKGVPYRTKKPADFVFWMRAIATASDNNPVITAAAINNIMLSIK